MTSTPHVELTRHQQEAYDAMVRGDSVFLTGPAGTGKTTLIKKFASACSSVDRVIAVTSTTGTSALIIDGVTLHSYLGIGLAKGSVNDLVKQINMRHTLKKRWRELSCLIIDEVSMLTSELFDKIEGIARRMKGGPRMVKGRSQPPFGGIQVIASGDFLQLPCIGDYAEPAFMAETWPRVITRTFNLETIIRQRDSDFQECLNDVRIGHVSEDVRRVLDPKIKRSDTSTANDTAGVVGIRETKLYCRNIDVTKINDAELDKLARDGREFVEYERQYIAHSGITDAEATRAYERYTKASIIPSNLQICVGAQVMLCKNIDFTTRMVNGSRGVVVRFKPTTDLPVVRFVNDHVATIPYDSHEVGEGDLKLCTAVQIPLRPAYAITIHKSQGMTLDSVSIDLKHVFAYGQAYVALSRCKDLSCLNIIDIDYNRIKADPVALAFYERLEV